MRLRELIVDHNYLEDLPKELGQCSFLEELNAESNRLITVPTRRGKPRRASRCVQVPASLGGLKTLRSLRLKDNKLERLP